MVYQNFVYVLKWKLACKRVLSWTVDNPWARAAVDIASIYV